MCALPGFVTSGLRQTAEAPSAAPALSARSVVVHSCPFFSVNSSFAPAAPCLQVNVTVPGPLPPFSARHCVFFDCRCRLPFVSSTHCCSLAFVAMRHRYGAVSAVHDSMDGAVRVSVCVMVVQLGYAAAKSARLPLQQYSLQDPPHRSWQSSRSHR